MKERSAQINLKAVFILGSHNTQITPLASESRFGLKQPYSPLLKDIIMFQDEFKHCRDSVLLASVANIFLNLKKITECTCIGWTDMVFIILN